MSSAEVVNYTPDWVEVTGRRLKMEYVGMGSVFAVIFMTSFSGLPHRTQAGIATVGSLALFLGLKKKTRDHLSVSFLLFAAAAIAARGVTDGRWFVPYALFGFCVWAMEGYLEKRRDRIYTLPLVLAGFAAVSVWWVLAFVFVATYLLEPRPDDPRVRVRLTWLVVVSALAAGVTAFISGSAADFASRMPIAHWRASRDGYLCFAVLGLGCLMYYWKRLAMPHRLNAILFGLLAPFDLRITALFGMVCTILLSATVFRQSVDSDRLRPYFKHAEWYFFPVAFAAALGLVVRR